jgi:single-strand DNA-binding protein
MNETSLTITGNLVDNPELRFTPAGQAVARFRVASTARYKDSASGQWKDGNTLFLTCVAWRQLAEHIAESLEKGMRAIVTGRLQQRTYETQEGEKRTVYELQVDDAGPALSRATAKVTKISRSGNGNGQAPADDEASGEASGDWPAEPPF